MTRLTDDAVVHPKWDAVFLVCRQCRKRKHAPQGMKPKTIARAVRERTREARPRPRIVLTSCLGFCPKGAAALAYAGAGLPPRMVAVRSDADLDTAVRSLVAHRERPG